MRSIRSRVSSLLVVAALTALTAAMWAGPASAATVRHVEGRVISVDRGASTFKLRDSQRGTFTIRVTNSTRFERVTFSALRAGRTVEATIRRVDGAWRATHVEPNAGRHAGDDNGGGGNDDPAGHH
jgi:Domain of unknown function (DUF5666)